jgi:hypothetical protein
MVPTFLYQIARHRGYTARSVLPSSLKSPWTTAVGIEPVSSFEALAKPTFGNEIEDVVVAAVGLFNAFSSEHSRFGPLAVGAYGSTYPCPDELWQRTSSLGISL